jgi:hypothetical protein
VRAGYEWGGGIRVTRSGIPAEGNGPGSIADLRGDSLPPRSAGAGGVVGVASGPDFEVRDGCQD